MAKTIYLKQGDVIQANEKAGSWAGCLLIVDEIHDWGGVTACMKIPERGIAYIRLRNDWFEVLGAEAVLVPWNDGKEEDDEEDQACD